MENEIQSYLQEGAKMSNDIALKLTDSIKKVTQEVIECYRRGNKILICGNGGSAADAQHFAAEFVNRFKIERKPLPVITLTTNASVLTSIGNDYGFDYVFSKQVEAFGKTDDLLIVITTSDISFEKNGHSTNIANALVASKKIGMKNIGLISKKSKIILDYLDHSLPVPHTDTPHIQEAHIAILHIICQIAEDRLFN